MKTLKKILKIFIFSVIILITLVASFITIENWRGKRAWESRVAEMKAKGEPTTLRELLGPEISEKENFAAFFYPLVKKQDGSFKAPERALKIQSVKYCNDGWEKIEEFWPSVLNGRHSKLENISRYYRSLKPSVKIEGLSDADVILDYQKQYLDIVNEYISFTERPSARFDFDGYHKLGAPVPHFLQMKLIQQVLSLRALAYIEKGNRNESFKITLAGFNVVNHMQSDIYLVSCMLNQSFFVMAVQPYWEGLQKHIWTDNELEQFAAILEQIDFLRGHVRTFQTERLFAFDFVKVDFYGSNGKSLRMRVFDTVMSTTPHNYPFLALLAWMAPKAFLYQNSVGITRYYEDFIYDQAIMEGRAPYATHPMMQDELYIKKLSIPKNPYQFVTSMSSPVAAKSLKQTFLSQVIVDETKLSVFLERYYLKHKEYPESLEQLVPEFVAEVPVDRYDGKSLRYQKLGKDSYRLYSVGSNLKDDGGFRGMDKTHQDGDLVWEVGVN